MSEREFEAYLNLLARTLRLSTTQRDRIANELRDHMEARLQELIDQGVDRDDAILQALDEFGDANLLADDLARPRHQQFRRRIMQTGFATVALAAMAALAVMYFTPVNRQGLPPQLNVSADETSTATSSKMPATPVANPNQTWDSEPPVIQVFDIGPMLLMSMGHEEADYLATDWAQESQQKFVDHLVAALLGLGYEHPEEVSQVSAWMGLVTVVGTPEAVEAAEAFVELSQEAIEQRLAKDASVNPPQEEVTEDQLLEEAREILLRQFTFAERSGEDQFAASWEALDEAGLLAGLGLSTTFYIVPLPPISEMRDPGSMVAIFARLNSDSYVIGYADGNVADVIRHNVNSKIREQQGMSVERFIHRIESGLHESANAPSSSDKLQASLAAAVAANRQMHDIRQLLIAQAIYMNQDEHRRFADSFGQLREAGVLDGVDVDTEQFALVPGLASEEIENPGQTVAIFSIEPVGGSYVAGFADGHAEQITPSQLRRHLAEQGLRPDLVAD
ncbi:MAG: permease prefix domain 1-containing protein [Planctomycetota bacterium]